jgi:CspA family cold shock protein
VHTGKIKKVAPERGFGFISDTEGREMFFHQSSLIDIRFDELREDQQVEFEVEKSPKGRGQMDKGFAMCGSNAYRIKKVVSVKELFAEIVEGARTSLKR